MTSLILVVDDFKTARELYVRTFKAGGYDVEEAHNGPEALEKSSQREPDMVLIDIIMPGMDGWETVRRLKEQQAPRDIPIVIITGAPQPDGARRAREAGCTYIVKPVLPEALLRMTGEMLGHEIARS